jgi:hypothetical protein
LKCNNLNIIEKFNNIKDVSNQQKNCQRFN